MADYTIFGGTADYLVSSHDIDVQDFVAWLNARAGNDLSATNSANTDAFFRSGDVESNGVSFYCPELFLGPFDLSAVPSGTTSNIKCHVYCEFNELHEVQSLHLRERTWSSGTGSFVPGEDLSALTLFGTLSSPNADEGWMVSSSGLSDLPRSPGYKLLLHDPIMLSETVPTGYRLELFLYTANNSGTTNDPKITLTVVTPTAYALTAGHGSFARSGQTAGLKSARKLAAAHGTFTRSGQAAAPRSARTMAAAQAPLVFAGHAAALLKGKRLIADRVTIQLAGPATGLRARLTLFAGHGSCGLSGQSAMLSRGRALQAGTGMSSFTGQVATFARSRGFSAGAGMLAVAGRSVTLTYTRFAWLPVAAALPPWSAAGSSDVTWSTASSTPASFA